MFLANTQGYLGDIAAKGRRKESKIQVSSSDIAKLSTKHKRLERLYGEGKNCVDSWNYPFN